MLLRRDDGVFLPWMDYDLIWLHLMFCSRGLSRPTALQSHRPLYSSHLQASALKFVKTQEHGTL